MGRKIHPIEREIDRIRLEIYKEIKDMTREEMHEYFSKSAHDAAKKHGFKIVSSIDDV